MAKFSIGTQKRIKIHDNDLRNAYTSEKASISSSSGDYPSFDYSDLDCIFEVACKNRKLFPSINIDKGTPDDALVSAYLHRWILSYCNAMTTLPSNRKASPKSSCSDPVVKRMVQQIQGLNDDTVNNKELAHIIFMSAENVLGNLLEEYISSNIEKYGWIWCAGNTLKSIDFCNSSGKTLLQIKNKSNSENSSSSSVRRGTTIKKWYRLGTSNQNGVLSPDYKWEKLNKIINASNKKGSQLPDCNMTEDAFVDFVVNAVIKNPEIITEK